jgi:DNA-binding NtrC family response regulator
MSTLTTECALRSASAQPTLLVIDDEPIVGYSFKRILSPDNVEVLTAPTGKEGLRLFREHSPDVVVLDYQLPDRTGLEVFREIHEADPRTPVLIITAHGTTDTAIEAMRLGAFDYLTKPVDYDRIRELLARAFEAVRLMEPPSLLPTADDNDRIIGHSAVMQDMCKLIGRVAPQDVTVLILGESGTGKELIARALYQNSKRANEPFLALNCAALPENLLESELFGHEKGAFTGADKRRVGKFEQCHGGTLFLDEIGEMSPAVQAKMLRVLQEKSFERVGSNEQLRTNVRLIAATNADLSRKVDAGAFRTDLFYRLRVVTIRVPPLRDRREDIPELATVFLFHFNSQLETNFIGFHPEAMNLLQQHSWPGNVRELQSIVKETMLRASGRFVLADDVETVFGQFRSVSAPAQSLSTHGAGENPERLDVERMLDEMLARGENGVYRSVLDQVERMVLARVLQHTQGKQGVASDVLGINRTTLRNRLRDLGMSVSRVVVDEPLRDSDS